VLGGTERISQVKARHAYPLLFLVPGAMLATMAAVLVGAAGAGVLWIFVYGDNPWPAIANAVVMALASAVWFAVLAGVLVVTHRIGKIRESRGGLLRAHVLVALGLSVGLPLLVILHQWQVGNLGGTQVPSNNSSKPTPLRGAA
jgi:membrane protein YdbS with pleckstrin-like domain